MFLFIKTAYKVAGSLTDVMIQTHRRKHLAYLMADQGALVNPESQRNLPKQVRVRHVYGFVLEIRLYWMFFSN